MSEEAAPAEKAKNTLHPKMEEHKFKKGCTPWNKGKKMPKKDKPRQEAFDDSTVKIHIVKEKKPTPPKEFEGKLEDVKERTAINFINSIIANKPKVVNVDGAKYYSSNVCEQLALRLQRAQALNHASKEALEKSVDTMNDMCKITTDLEKELEKTASSRMIWRAIAIGAIVGAFVLPICSKLVAAWKSSSWNVEKPAVIEQADK